MTLIETWAARDEQYRLRKLHSARHPLSPDEIDAVRINRWKEAEALTDPAERAKARLVLRSWTPPSVAA